MSRQVSDAAVRIDPPSPEDWETFKVLRLEALRTEPSAFASRYEDELRKSDREWQQMVSTFGRGTGTASLVAWRDRRAIGLVGAYRDGAGTWKVVSMYVTPDARRAGVGGALLDAILDRIHRAEPESDVQLLVNTERSEAIEFYRRRGFRIVETLRQQRMGDGQLHDEHRMKLDR
jgi:GNAT superfamily N-acetyltransferase